ncbi:DUF937 domain-containing protein [Flavobacterium amniphilum]|uniref:DUF937 domain-containing protein n=1 Tax=Flavobacterium amniphilum TaxID=1834035 RepID=UPI00202ABE84|nr:DUF937 domain-containing protein [Flavobacterium amniphilum]MCL9804582.1 DUF937 domain-containing protein [Flavobacterium amniphilum]
MAGILDLINSDLGKQIISGIGNQAGTTESETSSVLTSALPTLVNAMQNNATTEEGAGGLLGALLGGKHDGGLLDNLGSMLGGGGIDTEDGGKILGHVLGGEQSNIESNLSQSTGVSTDKIGMILKLAAPILMAYLANKAKGSNVQSGTDLGGLLGGLLGGGSQSQAEDSSSGGSILTSVLDQDGDGQLGVGDAVAAATKKGGLGGFLSSIFGRK